MKLLHIEDDEDFRVLVSYMLGSEAEVVSAGTLAEAREKLVATAFDLVLLDLGLPDSTMLNSLYVVRAICSAPILVFSGCDDPALLWEAAQMGADDYILKDGLTRDRLLKRVWFASGRQPVRGTPRKRMGAMAMESLRPYITQGTVPPFVRA